MNKERMLLLADLLDSLKPSKFDMTNWFSTYVGENGPDESEIDRDEDFEIQHVMKMNGYDCNSAACIAGWAVVMKHDFAVNKPDVRVIQYADSPYSNAVLPVLDEAAEYLGLNEFQARELFTDEDYSVWSRHWDYFVHNYNADCDSFRLASVTPKMAAVMVRNLANGEWSFDEYNSEEF